jgi:hypothetical protein
MTRLIFPSNAQAQSPSQDQSHTTTTIFTRRYKKKDWYRNELFLFLFFFFVHARKIGCAAGMSRPGVVMTAILAP